MANKTQDYGDLRVTLTSEFDWRWDDTSTGSNVDGGFWHPRSQSDMRPFGSIVIRGRYDPNNQQAVMLVGNAPNCSKPAVASPVRYEWVWSDKGSGGKHDAAVWRPVAPDNYVALGDVVTNGPAPGVDQVWCLRADLTKAGSYEGSAVWDDRGSGADLDASFWRLVPRPNTGASELIPVMPGTFFYAWGHDNQPPADAARVPGLYVPRELKPITSRPPSLKEDQLPDIGQSFETTSMTSVALPFTGFFPDNHRSCLNKISDPFCTISKIVSWTVLDRNINDTSSQLELSTEVKTGVRSSKSTTQEHQVGVSVTTESGYGLAQFSVTLNYQFTFSQTSTFEELQERTITRKMPVAPYSAVFAWGRRVEIKGRRSDGAEIDGNVAFNANEEIAFTEIKLSQ